MPNQDQLLSVLRTLIGFGSGIAVGKGLVTVDQATMIGDATLTTIGGAATLVPLIWGLFAHTTSAKIAAVTALPDVKKIVTVSVPINPAVAAAASDATQTKVAPAP